MKTIGQELTDMTQAMADVRFLQMTAFHAQIEAGLQEISRLCAFAEPHLAELSGARLRLSRASSARSRFIMDEVIPFLQRDGDASLRQELYDLQTMFAAKRMKSSEHVARWSARTIGADWDGYRADAQRIWVMMRDQMELERQVLASRLSNNLSQAISGRLEGGG